MYNNLSRRLSTVSSFFNTGHFLSREEILAIKATWNSVIGEDTGMHGINIFLMYFWSIMITDNISAISMSIQF